MNERQMFKIALIVSFAGILLLMTLSIFEVEKIDVADVKDMPLDSRVKIEGTIKGNNKINPTFYILKVADDTGTIDVLLDKNFTGEGKVEVVGTLSEYKNKTQIQAERIIEK